MEELIVRSLITQLGRLLIPHHWQSSPITRLCKPPSTSSYPKGQSQTFGDINSIMEYIKVITHLTDFKSEPWILVCMTIWIGDGVNLWMKIWWRIATGSLGQLWLPSFGLKSIENGTEEELPWHESYLRKKNKKKEEGRKGNYPHMKIPGYQMWWWWE